MIAGVVQAHEGRIHLRIRGPRGRERSVEAVIDTGFTASLTLPPNLVAALGLRWKNLDRGILADGSQCVFDVYVAEVEWDGQTKRILVNEFDAVPLVGMTLLDGYQLTMHVRSGGKLTIKRLPRRRHS
jgi:clan AA aspartic protease